MITILSLLRVVMSSVTIHPMVQYENDLISIFMNVYVNLQKIGKLFKNYKPGWGVIGKDIFSCMTKCLVGPAEDIVLKLNPLRIFEIS